MNDLSVANHLLMSNRGVTVLPMEVLSHMADNLRARRMYTDLDTARLSVHFFEHSPMMEKASGAASSRPDNKFRIVSESAHEMH